MLHWFEQFWFEIILNKDSIWAVIFIIIDDKYLKLD